jgi:hypothetical protein
MELRYYPNPAQWTSLTEIALAPSSRVRLAVIRGCNGGHRCLKIPTHLDMLLQNVVPGHVIHLDETSLGVPDFAYDAMLADAARLGISPDGDYLAREM